MKLDIEMHLKIGIKKPETKKEESDIDNEPKGPLGVFTIEPRFSKDLTSTTNSLKNSTYQLNFNDDEEICEAQISAAKRSLITNLFLTALCVLANSAFIFLPSDISPYFAVLVLSSLKGALPISTTIANFGTVSNVISAYLQYFKK